MVYDISVSILRRPTADDWNRCKDLAMRTMGKTWTGNEVTDEWMHKMLECRHSPIRTLMFTIEITCPYFVSVHLVRHKIGVEHFVQSQRNDRQSSYDRQLAPQNSMVTHTMDINAESLMIMSNRRLCGQADPTTRYTMTKICREVEEVNPEFKGHLVPMCHWLRHCPEAKPCGWWENQTRTDQMENMEPAYEITGSTFPLEELDLESRGTPCSPYPTIVCTDAVDFGEGEDTGPINFSDLSSHF